MRFSSALFLLLLTLRVIAQDVSKPPGSQKTQGLVFRVVKTQGTRIFVSANRSGITAWLALKDLEDLGAFQLNLEISGLKEALENESISLSLSNKDAVHVAELICVSAGLDSNAERLDPVGGERVGRLALIVVSPGPARTEESKRGLREWALRWYERFLSEDIRELRETATEETRVQIDMGLLNLAQGNILQASKNLELFIDNAPDHPYVPEAMLKLAESYFELGELETCISSARRLMTIKSRGEIGIEAAILLAKARLEQSRRLIEAGNNLEAQKGLDDLVHVLGLYLSGYRNKSQYSQLILLLAGAHRMRGRSDQVLEKMRQLETVVDPLTLPESQWASLNFLRGDAEIKIEDVLHGEKLLWLFIQNHPKDPRVATAWLSVAEAELRMNDPMQSLLAARMALGHPSNINLLRDERSRALILEAKCLLGLGKFNESIVKLKMEVLKNPKKSLDLILYLSRVLLDAGLPERAKRLLRGHERVRKQGGDQVRLMIIEAYALQKNHGMVIDQAKKLAADILDPQVQEKVSEFTGDAYSALGKPRLAAQAYSGRIR